MPCTGKACHPYSHKIPTHFSLEAVLSATSTRRNSWIQSVYAHPEVMSQTLRRPSRNSLQPTKWAALYLLSAGMIAKAGKIVALRPRRISYRNMRSWSNAPPKRHPPLWWAVYVLAVVGILSLNAGQKVACDDLGAEFVDNDPSFHLQDGTINDGYLLSDGVHLSRAATNKLVSNLKLQLHHGETSAHHVNRQWRLAPQQAKDSTVLPNGDDGDMQHAFWQRARQKGSKWKHPGQQARVLRPRVTHNVTGVPASRPAKAHRYASPFPAASPADGHAAVPQPSPGHRRNAMTHSQAAPPPHPPQPAPRPYSYGQIRATPGAGRAHNHGPQTLPTPTRTNPQGFQNHRNFSHVPPTHHSEHQFCQLCHGAGHTAVTCGSRESECFKCHQNGHLARACTE